MEMTLVVSVFACMMLAQCVVLAQCVAEPFHCPPCCKCKPVKMEVMCNACNLTQVPVDLPTTTRRLILNTNRIRNLTDSVFARVPDIYHLELAANNIHYIGPSTFKHLPRLSFLDMSSNPTWPKVIAAFVLCVLPRKVIRTLNFKQMSSWTIMGKSRFQCLQNTTLEELDLSANEAALNVENGTFANLKHLKSVIIKQTPSKLFNVFAYENDTKLSRLVLSQNYITTFPKFAKLINGHYESVLPGLQMLDLSDNKILKLDASSLYGLDNLKTLILTNNYIPNLGPGVIQPLKSLVTLFLDGNQIERIDPKALNSSTLLNVYFQNNKGLIFTTSRMDAFRKCPNIQAVYIDGASFSSFYTMEAMFQNMTTLQTLSLARISRFTHIPTNMFCGLHNLATLHLEGNLLRNIDWSMFRDLISLQKLYLNSNRISYINQTSLPKHVWHNLTLLDVSDNRFICDCDLFWFVDWVQSHKNSVNSLNATFCENQSRKTILEVQINSDTCIYKPLSTGIKISWWISAGMVLVAVLYSAVVHYQWHFRTFIFKFSLYWNSSRPPTVNQQNLQQEEYTFDVFVCYNSDDREWVRNVLVPELEDSSQPPLQVCEYDRNWPFGQSLFTCIEQSIQCSRKILLIVTNAFTQSEWCQFELLSVQQNLLHHDKDNVILAIMEDIEPQNMTPSLFLEMKRKTYLEWTDEEVGRRLFFERLRQSLQKPNSSMFRAMPNTQLIHSY